MENELKKIELMRFVTPLDFYNNRRFIKKKYNELSEKGKEIYKWYFFYELCMIKNPLKEMLWDYLNLEEEYIDVYFVSNLSREMSNFKRRKPTYEEQEEIDNLFDWL